MIKETTTGIQNCYSIFLVKEPLMLNHFKLFSTNILNQECILPPIVATIMLYNYFIDLYLFVTIIKSNQHFFLISIVATTMSPLISNIDYSNIIFNQNQIQKAIIVFLSFRCHYLFDVEMVCIVILHFINMKLLIILILFQICYSPIIIIVHNFKDHYTLKFISNQKHYLDVIINYLIYLYLVDFIYFEQYKQINQ